MRERITDWLVKWRYLLFGVWLVHVFLIHYFIIGFMSWDGFGHRGFPIIELLKHGDLGKDKFDEWSLVGYTPFIELAHLPFLLIFKLRGLIIGFPLVVFPLCVGAVFAFVQELTGDKRAATFGAFAFAAIPMINQQPFTGYIDFAVVGILAYWLFALLRLRHPERRGRALVRFGIATFLFTMARSQGPYVVVVMFPLLAFALFCTRERWKVRVTEPRLVMLAIVAVVIGMAPAVAIQIHKYIAYGSPVAPMELSFLGIKLGKGVTMNQYFQYAGLGGDDITSLLHGFWDGWVWHAEWPLSAFYASRFVAAGLLFLVALVLSPVFARRATRLEWWILGAGALVSLMSRDFAVPRWGYTTMLAICLLIGRSMSVLTTTKSWRGAYGVVLVLLGVHLLRPELDILQLQSRKWLSPQLNVVGSKRFINGGWTVEMYPDHDYKLAILGATGNHFIIQLYGKRLTNDIVGTIPDTALGPQCATLRELTAIRPEILYVDDADLTKDCPERECVIKGPYCLGWRIQWPH
ncbi:hypothetical protein BH11MYX3_BH11MYX3_20440 [soil metagenome]